jgi:hypothetical protein
MLGMPALPIGVVPPVLGCCTCCPPLPVSVGDVSSPPPSSLLQPSPKLHTTLTALNQAKATRLIDTSSTLKPPAFIYAKCEYMCKMQATIQ